MPMSGLQLIQALLRAQPDVNVIAVTGNGDRAI